MTRTRDRKKELEAFFSLPTKAQKEQLTGMVGREAELAAHIVTELSRQTAWTGDDFLDLLARGLVIEVARFVIGIFYDQQRLPSQCSLARIEAARSRLRMTHFLALFETLFPCQVALFREAS